MMYPGSRKPVSIKRALRKCRSLEGRIVRAYGDGDRQKRRKAEYLYRLYCRSLFALVGAIERLSRRKSARTPGIDGVTWRNEKDKQTALMQLRKSSAPSPGRLFEIDKGNGQMRALMIATLKDRARQLVLSRGMQGIVEKIVDPHTFGFRPNRSAQDAILYCKDVLEQNSALNYVLEGDIRAFFDCLSHEFILNHLPFESLRTEVEEILKAGYIKDDTWHQTSAGTPQGGIISPLLALLALAGLETLIQERFPGSRFVGYADDFCVFAHDESTLLEIKAVISEFLAERNLELSELKTLITPVESGFDFLGAHIRALQDGVHIEPSQKSISRLWKKVNDFLTQPDTVRRKPMPFCASDSVQGWMDFHRVWLSEEQQTAIWQRFYADLAQWQSNKYHIRTEGTEGFALRQLEQVIRADARSPLKHVDGFGI